MIIDHNRYNGWFTIMIIITAINTHSFYGLFSQREFLGIPGNYAVRTPKFPNIGYYFGRYSGTFGNEKIIPESSEKTTYANKMAEIDSTELSTTCKYFKNRFIAIVYIKKKNSLKLNIILLTYIIL